MELQTSTPTNNIYTQLIAAQHEINRIEKNAKVQAGAKNYNYATLPQVYDAVEDHLHNNGLVFSATIDGSKNYSITDEIFCFGLLRCSLFHAASGQELKSDVPLLIRETKETFANGSVKKGSDPMQMIGSAVTYATRYGLLSLIAKTPEMDTDCNPRSTISENKSSPVNVTPAPRAIAQPEQTLSDTQRMALTLELHELWKVKEGSVRAEETDMSKRAILLFKNDLAGVNDSALIKLKDYLLKMKSVIIHKPAE